MNEIKAIFFDVGWTLSYPERSLWHSFAEVIREGQAKQVFQPDLDPLLMAKAVFGVLDEMATDWILSSHNTRLAGKATPVADLILGGLRCT